MEPSEQRKERENGDNAAQESKQPHKRKNRDETTYDDITGVASESSSDRKVSSTSDHFRFSSVSAASQDIKQQAGNQSSANATDENESSIVQYILNLLVTSQNPSNDSFGGDKVTEDPPSLQDTSSCLSQAQQEQIATQLSSSSSHSAISTILETIVSQQKEQQILADFLTANSQQQHEQDHLNMLVQLLSSLSQQQQEQQRQEQQIEANRLNSQSQLLKQLFNQIANTSSNQDSYSGFTSDPLQNVLVSLSQHSSNSSMTDSQSLLTSLLNVMPTSSSSETTNTSQDAGRGTLPLATPNDSDRKLSDYQVLLRQQLEFFVAQHTDVDSSTQGRRKQVQLGQVGLRCRHCAHLPLRSRERGAVYYPAKLENVYQSAQNMASTHLMESCKHIDAATRRQLQELRDRKHTAMGGKTQWAEACQEMGLHEVEESGLRLSTAPFHSS